MLLITVPTGTDAPIYHLPIVTGFIVLVSVVCFALQLSMPEQMEVFYLHHGSINPLTWITHSFVHEGFGHIIGNMIFLIVSGLIIEGRCGPLKFLGLYMAIAIVSGGMQQLAMFPFGNGEEYSIGANGCVYGLFAVAMLWMPETKVNIFVAGIFFLYPIWRTFTTSVMNVVFVMISIQFLIVWFTFFAVSSAMLQLLGAIPGFAVGYLMLVRQWVDCEGHDLLTQNFNYKPKLTKAKKEQLRQEKERRKQHRKDAISEARQKIAEHVENGRYELAISRLESMRRKLQGKANFTAAEMYKIVRAYDEDPAKRKHSKYLLDRYLSEQPNAPAVLVLASARQYLVHLEAPRKALAILKEIDVRQVSEQEKKLMSRLMAVAKKKIRDGVIEFTD